MPAEGPALTENQMELLTRWVKAGTPMPANEVEAAVESDHWAFRPIKRPPVPEVDASARRLNPIDHFILKRLDEQQQAFSLEVDRDALSAAARTLRERHDPTSLLKSAQTGNTGSELGVGTRGQLPRRKTQLVLKAHR